jgi:hypothetical protein
MPKRPSKPAPSQSFTKDANPKGEKFTAKHAKLTAHRATERRVTGKGRG